MDTHKPRQATARQTASSSKLPAGTDRETLLKYYYEMLLVRRFEEKAAEMYTKARIGGYCHLNLGEEATVVGFCAGLESDDYVYTNYREHGYAICRGLSPESVMAELFGKKSGTSSGRGGSMHLFDLKRRFMGGYAIVGGQVPLAVGAAFAVAYRGTNEIVACQMGDGTTNGGPFYESLNLAKIYKVPLLFFIVNNKYGMGLAVEQGSAVAELYRKADAFDMRSVRVDGNDILAVRDAVQEATQFIRKEHEPYLIEAVSFRFKGHSVVDPDRYRSAEEIKKGRADDPIPAFAAHLKAWELIDDKGLGEIEERVEQAVAAAVKFAEESEYPPVGELFEHIYAPDGAQEERD